MQDGDRAVLAPHHDDLLGTEGGEDEVARAGDLALVRHVQPGAAEDALLLEPEYLRVDVRGAVHRVAPHEIQAL
jgi:hypothetical protein